MRSLTFGIIVLAVASAGRVSAADRLPPISPDKYTEAQKQAAEEFRTARGYDVRGPFTPFLRSPEVLTRVRSMGDYLRYKSSIGPRLNEMAILITNREWSQPYEWAAHYPIAIKEGLRREIADAIADGRRPAEMSPEEESVYDVSYEIVRNKRVSDVTFNKAVERLGEQGVVDLLSVQGYYTFLAVVVNATRTCTIEKETPACPAWASTANGTSTRLQRFPD